MDIKKPKKSELKRMSVDELHALRQDLGRMINLRQNEVSILKGSIEQITHLINRHETQGALEVCDHMVVRYLERVKGVDITSIRTEIVDNVRAAHGNVEVKGTATGVLHNDYVYVLHPKKKAKVNVIATVFEARDYQMQANPMEPFNQADTEDDEE